MLTLICACSAPTQRPDKVESVLDVIHRAEAEEAARPAGKCPGAMVPVCVSAFRHEEPRCSCADPMEMSRAYEQMH
jgi:hypothetical protein